jgi:hypothetical protein
MFEKKKIVVLLAAAAMVAACGGGGGNGGVGAPTTDASTSPIETGNKPAPGNPAGETGAVADQQLKGHLDLVANQLVYLKKDRSIYDGLPLDHFESGTGMYDVASGSKGQDSGAKVPATAAAPAAPIAAFGFRVDKFVQRSTTGEAVGDQTVTGRIAFDLTERDASPGIQAGDAAEIMKFVIDGVELSTGQNGELTSARVREGAQMHVYGRNAKGVEVRETIAVPAGAVRLMPVSNVMDHYGDDSSVVLLADLEAAFSQAGQRLAALENIAGHFSMQVTMSTAQVVRPASPDNDQGPALERRVLVGQQIAVNNQPPVTGAGVSGSAWIRMDPQ